MEVRLATSFPVSKLPTLRDMEWVEEHPPMKTARSYPAVATTTDYLIVIVGNYGSGNWTDAVEVYRNNEREWLAATNLPKPLPYPSAAIYGDGLLVRVIGIDASQFLYVVDSQKESPLFLSTASLAPLPVTESTIATLGGKLVLIGGHRIGSSSINSILQSVDSGWVEIGSMNTGRRLCSAAHISEKQILIVGGYGGLDCVDECSIVYDV